MEKVDGIKTATKALEQASNELRPWVMVKEVNKLFGAENMLTKFQITNIGRIPAYFTVKTNGYVDGVLLNHDQDNKILVIMPNQIMVQGGLNIKGDSYKKILNKEFSGMATYDIRIDYGISKDNISEYYTYLNFRFDKEDNPSNKEGIWDLIESDFQ